MTHNDIYTKFMIEYDKANVTSSYPSLTKYEVYTILDKAYLALIAQKVTGNNARRTAFETDHKSISDLQQLIVKKVCEMRDNFPTNTFSDSDNSFVLNLPNDFLYYVNCSIKKKVVGVQTEDVSGDAVVEELPMDQSYGGKFPTTRFRRLNVKLIPHGVADSFRSTANNIPWIKNPVCYIEHNQMYILYDSYDKPSSDFCELTYIKTPATFTGNSDDIDFELNSTMAEELISLAVVFALENIESQRLASKTNIRGLEA